MHFAHKHSYFRQTGCVEVSNRVMHKMRCQVFDHLQKMSAAFHHDNKSGDLVTRINNDVEQVHPFVWNVATNIWIDSIILIVYLALMAMINIPLTLLSAFFLPLSVLITKRIRMHIRAESKKVRQNIATISGYMQERMAGYETVKLFHMEQYESDRFGEYSGSIYKYTLRQNHPGTLAHQIL